ncbi:MAG: bifunctional oligoribonuclease/PAP phosphatase NrnA [Clostridiales bacterium]|nr:bifunctional oligoribonuclease/PAP phosphatase NrnA [Clostridiales bacterium]
MNDEFTKKLCDAVNRAETVVISAHINADGDAVGSTLAMSAFVEALGKKPVVFIHFKGSKYDYILNKSRLFSGSRADLKPDVFIALDCGDRERLGDEGKALFEKSAVTFNIDHHISNTGYGNYNFVFPKASSTCELVYEIITRKPGFVLDKYTAECLYTGIITDTSTFKHSSTGARTMRIAADLIETGIDFTEIQAKMLYRHDLTASKVFAEAVLNARLEDKIAYTTLTLKEIRAHGAIFEQLDGIVEYCLNINGAVVSVFLYERGENQIRCSFRSTGLDVNKIASGFGGGGHVCAAGCTMDGISLDEALKLCLSALKTEAGKIK